MMTRMSRGLAPLLRTLVVAAVYAPTAALGADSSGKVSEISDPRIKESSGLAISSAHDDLAYTINDAGNPPIVFAIKVSTGDVVGTTRVEGGRIRDTESIAIDGDGTMWLADLGDNDEERDDVALYAFPEPGRGDHTVTAARYPVSYENGPVDVEALLVHPTTGAKFLASKNKKSAGAMFALPKKLSETSPNVATDLAKPVPEDVSDGAFTVDGEQAVLRTRKEVYLVDPASWQTTGTVPVPPVEQGESIAMEPSGTSFVVGSEGKDSPLIRVPYAPVGSGTATRSPTPSSDQSTSAPEKESSGVPPWLAIAAGLIAVGAVATAAWVVARRR
jgi:hypothetical protein